MKKYLILIVMFLFLFNVGMGIEIVRQKNVATVIFFPIVDESGDHVIGADGDTPDSETDTWADGSNPDGFADLTNEIVEIASDGWYYLALTQGELNFDYIAIQVKTATATTLTQNILIRTITGDPLDIGSADMVNYDGATPLVASDNIGINWADVANQGSGVALSGTSIDNVATATAVSNQVTADVTAISGSAAAANNLETFFDDTGSQFTNFDDMYDGTGYAGGTIEFVVDLSATGVNDIWDEPVAGHTTALTYGDTLPQMAHQTLDVVNGIVLTGTNIATIAEASTLTDGIETNDYVATQILDETYYQIAESDGVVGTNLNINTFLQFDIGPDAKPFALIHNGRLDEGSAPSSNDTLHIWVFDWSGGGSWTHINPPEGDFVGIFNSSSSDDVTFEVQLIDPNFVSDDSGKVRIAYSNYDPDGATSNNLEEDTEFFLNFAFVEYQMILTATTIASVVTDSVWKSDLETYDDEAGSFADSAKGWGATGASTNDKPSNWTAADTAIVRAIVFKADTATYNGVAGSYGLILAKPGYIGNVTGMENDVITADAIKANAFTAAKFANDAIDKMATIPDYIYKMVVRGSPTTTSFEVSYIAPSPATEANDFYNGLFVMPTTGNAAKQVMKVADFAIADSTFTIRPGFASSTNSGDTVLVLPARGGIEAVVLTNDKIAVEGSGFVSVGAMASGVIDGASIVDGAIDSAKLADDYYSALQKIAGDSASAGGGLDTLSTTFQTSLVDLFWGEDSTGYSGIDMAFLASQTGASGGGLDTLSDVYATKLAGLFSDSLMKNNNSQILADGSGFVTANMSSGGVGSIWNKAFDFAYDAGSMGDSLTNATYVQGLTNGSGTEPETLVVLSTSDSTAIESASIVIRTLNQTTIKVDGWLTDVNGLANLELDIASYFRSVTHNNYTQVNDTLVVANDGGTDTVWMIPFDPGSPTAGGTGVLYGRIHDMTGAILQGAIVTITIPDKFKNLTHDGVVVTPFNRADTTDSNGDWSISLYQYNELSDTTAYYIVTANEPSSGQIIGGEIFSIGYLMPDSTQHRLSFGSDFDQNLD